ncbi:MAG: hypothetical protein ACRD6W_17470, partial [Nitrososphaerales archaeon]
MPNRELARRVRTAINNNRRAFDMSSWVEAVDADGDALFIVTPDASGKPECDTTLCLAGHALVQSGQYELYVKEDGEVWFRDVVTKEDV